MRQPHVARLTIEEITERLLRLRNGLNNATVDREKAGYPVGGKLKREQDHYRQQLQLLLWTYRDEIIDHLRINR